MGSREQGRRVFPLPPAPPPLFRKSGVIGDATTATKEKGDRILKSVANGWVQLIQDIYAYCLSTTKSRKGIDAFYSKLKIQYIRRTTTSRFANVEIMEIIQA